MAKLKAHQLKVNGWYWWRLSVHDEWRIEYFDPIRDAAALKITGGEFVGPLTPPTVTKKLDAVAS